jgi:hypothetical protein
MPSLICWPEVRQQDARRYHTAAGSCGIWNTVFFWRQESLRIIDLRTGRACDRARPEIRATGCISGSAAMKHLRSSEDQTFLKEFEAFTFPPAEFDHRAHVRLAYVYLCEHDTDAAYQLMKRSLLSFITHHGADISKYHETITRAWIMAVRHFMENTPDSRSSDDFIGRNPRLLDSKIMLTHYSAELLFSEEARAGFVEPNLDPIPRYEA